MKQLKVALICPYDYFRFGGVQEHIRAVKEELTNLGHEAWVIAPEASTPNNTGEKRVIQLGGAANVNTPMATSAEITFSASPKQIVQILKEHQFDVLHFHEPWVPVLSRQILSRSISLNVATFHAKLPDNLLNKSIEKVVVPYGRRMNEKLNLITAVSEAAKEVVQKTTELEIKLIPNGIDLAKYDPKKVTKFERFDDGSVNVLYVGRLEKRKGVNYLLKAFRQLDNADSRIRLIVAGDGPKMRSLKSYAARHQLNAEFLGFVSEEDKLKLLKLADVFCSPAIYGESFGIVLLEAMAMNCAVIAGNNPGYAAVMQQRGYNSLIEPTDTDLFAKKIELFCRDSQMRELMVEWQSDYVRQFDYREITKRYLHLYRTKI